MIKEIYVVYDNEIKKFGNPFFFDDGRVALRRAIKDSARTDEGFALHLDTMEWFKIGEYENGMIKETTNDEVLISGKDIIQELREEAKNA